MNLSTRLLLTLLLASVATGVTASAARAAPATACDQTAVEQCIFDQDVYLLMVNVFDPQYEFDMVMAHEATTADLPAQRERVRDMVTRTEQAARSPILAINADYFGDWGPEGLTVKQGVRIPNAGRNNATESVRSSLSISQDHALRLGQQLDCTSTAPNGCSDWVPDPQRYFTTVGGGPLFIEDGHPVQRFAGDVLPCDLEQLNRAYCTAARPWSAVGMTADGKTLVLAATAANKTMWQMAQLLLKHGAWRAMKLDGGGSTQLWQRGAELAPSSDDRGVANALVVFARPENCPLFCDVWLDNVFFDDIQFVRAAGLTQGFGDGTFRPDNSITRAEAATLIWRWLGRPAADSNCTVTFPDFPPEDSPHYPALRYLACAGILRGFGDGTLRPDADISRGETVALILRVLATLRPGEDPLIDPAWAAIRAELGRFPDAPGVGVHDDNIARSRWIGLVHGYSDGLFRPDLPVSRGQFAKILTRALYYGEYSAEIFIPCAIDYATLLADYTNPGTQTNNHSATACRTPAALQIGPDQLLVAPQQITFTVAGDGSVTPYGQALDVTLGGMAQAGWQATTDQAWISVAVPNGATSRSAMVQLTADAELTPGQHVANLTVSIEEVKVASGDPVTIALSVDVAAPNPAPLAGDVSCDGVQDSIDALFVLQYDVGLRRAGDACQAEADTLALSVCDLNGDDLCNALDALWILQCDVGISNPACP